MPKVTCYFDPRLSALTAEVLNGIGYKVKDFVATAVSTYKHHITKNDVDWVPIPYTSGSIVKVPVSIEIATIGYPDIVAKLDDLDTLTMLRRNILGIDGFPQIKTDQTLIWVHFISPDSLHA